MWFHKIRDSFRTRISSGLFMLCLIASIVAGAADTKW
jgi:hypothetical protein